ncbi:hypothetical protein P278_21380 [Zhouia amylolytica AD3]|uniref:Uncharacterized protein n=1 Tax=Zhouia amylolytica AD3 TaxID=1286632 RepID=W2ULB9_9FLAO|nr:hypothetical protein P278_21380 [Zhouia amylolytica AD3]
MQLFAASYKWVQNDIKELFYCDSTPKNFLFTPQIAHSLSMVEAWLKYG